MRDYQIKGCLERAEYVLDLGGYQGPRMLRSGIVDGKPYVWTEKRNVPHQSMALAGFDQAEGLARWLSRSTTYAGPLAVNVLELVEEIGRLRSDLVESAQANQSLRKRLRELERAM